MQISETTSDQLEKIDYKFERLEFPAFSKELEEKLTQWGLKNHLSLERFRFNKNFTDFDSEELIKALLNSDIFRSIKMSYSICGSSSISSVLLRKKRCTQMNLNFLDKLEEHGIFC